MTLEFFHGSHIHSSSSTCGKGTQPVVKAENIRATLSEENISNVSHTLLNT